MKYDALGAGVFGGVLLIGLAVLATFIVLGIFLIKVLARYLKASDARKEKSGIKKSLGEALKQRREACKMTQEFVAETLGVSRQSVSTWENGFRDPNTSNLIALAKLYKISPEQLLECAARMPDGENNIE